jgi:hypothetical protein
MTEVNPIMVQTLAKMTGKTEAEVLKFLEKKNSPPEGIAQIASEKQPTPEVHPLLKDLKLPLPLQDALPVEENAKSLAPKDVVDEVITEEVPLDSLTPEQLEEAEAENNTFSDSIRVGSKIRVTWEPNVGRGKIKWVGKVGTVIQKLSDHGVSVYLVEFPAGKIPFQKIDKKSGKLQRGYHTKKLQQWLDENNIELVF